MNKEAKEIDRRKNEEIEAKSPRYFDKQKRLSTKYYQRQSKVIKMTCKKFGHVTIYLTEEHNPSEETFSKFHMWIKKKLKKKIWNAWTLNSFASHYF